MVILRKVGEFMIFRMLYRSLYITNFSSVNQFLKAKIRYPIPLYSNFRDVFYFYYEKKYSRKTFPLNVCEATLQAARAYKKAGTLARNSQISVASNWTYHFSHN